MNPSLLYCLQLIFQLKKTRESERNNRIIKMEETPIGVLLIRPLSIYLQQELSKRYTLFKFWQVPPELRREFLGEHSDSIKAVVANGVQGADTELIDALPFLEIVASHSSGLDKIDLDRCREKGITVTYTPDALTDEVADMAVLLTLATLRRICEADRFVRSGAWMNADFNLTAKVKLLFNPSSSDLITWFWKRLGTKIPFEIPIVNQFTSVMICCESCNVWMHFVVVPQSFSIWPLIS